MVDQVLDMQTLRLEHVQCTYVGCIAHTKGALVAPVGILLTQLHHTLLQLHGAGQMIAMQLHQLNTGAALNAQWLRLVELRVMLVQ